MHTQESLKSSDLREFEWPFSKRFIFQEIENTLIVNNFAMKFIGINYHGNPQFLLIADRGIDFIREALLNTYQRIHSSEGVGSLVMSISPSLLNRIYVGNDCRISLNKKLRSGFVMLFESSSPLDCAFFSDIDKATIVGMLASRDGQA